MRLLLILLPLFLQYWEDSDVVAGFRRLVGEITLACHEGRAPGSEGESEVARYVWTELEEGGVDMLCGRECIPFGIVTSQGDTLVSHNVAGMVQGYDPVLKRRYIVVGARLDNTGTNVLMVDGQKVTQIYAGANGNASGVAMMVSLASSLARNSVMLRRSVIFVGFGGSTASFAGAWNFLHDTFAGDADKIDAMVNLDMLGLNRDGMKAFTCGNSDMNNMLARLSSSLQPVKPTIALEEPYPSDHQVFYSARIPSVMFSTGRYSEHNTPKDTQSILDYEFMEREQEFLYNFILELANAPEGVPAFDVPEKVEKTGVKDNGIPWSDCDVPPMFMNNPDPAVFMHRWVYTYLKYPQDCIEEGVSGRVMVEFTISAEGVLEDVRVVRGVDERLDEAALKVICASPKWKPARKNGKKQACSMTVPVEFRLRQKK